jgi:acyl-coenzyme A synthetase/AMP-(fatty) acid ligase
VVSRPDPELGEVPVARVVLRAGHSMNAAQVKALFEGRLAEYRRPREALFLESLPPTALGKAQKSVLRERVNSTTTPTRQGASVTTAQSRRKEQYV